MEATKPRTEIERRKVRQQLLALGAVNTWLYTHICPSARAYITFVNPFHPQTPAVDHLHQ